MKINTRKKLFHDCRFYSNKALVQALITMVFFLSPVIATAASQTYYVTYSGSGSQSGLSFGNSWSWSDFLSSANWSATEDAAKIDPGDTVYFSGTFTLTSSAPALPSSGTSGNYIILDGDDGVNPSATFTTSGGLGSGAVVFNFGRRQYFELRDITFNSGGWSTDGILLAGADYIKIYDCVISIYSQNVIRVVSNSHDVDIYDNTISWAGANEASSPECINITGAHDINIYRNSFDNCQHNGVMIVNSETLDVYNIDVYENYFDLSVAGYGRAFGASGNYEAVNSWTSVGDAYNIYFHHNYINKQRSPSGFDSVSYAYIHNNIFAETPNCCESADNAGCERAYSNCSSKTYHKSGFVLALTTTYGDMDHVYVYNNFLGPSAETGMEIRTKNANLQCDGSGDPKPCCTGSGTGTCTSDQSYIYIKNNIFYDNANACAPSDDPPGSTATFSDRAFYFYDRASLGALSNWEWENNIVYPHNSVGKDIYWDGTYYATIAHFDAGSPAGVSVKQNNLASDPLLVDSDNRDFTLQPGSPAVDAGTNLGSNYAFGWNPNTLIPPKLMETLNQNEFGSGWDVGAYIFNSLSKPNPPPNPPKNFGHKLAKKKEEG